MRFRGIRLSGSYRSCHTTVTTGTITAVPLLREYLRLSLALEKAVRTALADQSCRARAFLFDLGSSPLDAEVRRFSPSTTGRAPFSCLVERGTMDNVTLIRVVAGVLAVVVVGDSSFQVEEESSSIIA